jgi:putative transposon-encoded protein
MKKEVTILGSKGKIGEPKKQLKWGKRILSFL